LNGAVVRQFETSHPISEPNTIAAAIAASHDHGIGSGLALGRLPDGFPVIDHLHDVLYRP
jgi:hypothetical protein